MATDEIVFRMVLDPSDMEKLLGIGPSAVAGAGAGAAGGGGGVIPVRGQVLPGQQDAGGEGMKVKQDPSFKSIFKPLAALSIMEKTLGGILKHSSIANSYLGAMGKMFGAAIDMLLMPLTPIFNLLMVAMAKLLQWLVTSGVLEKLYEIFTRVSENIKAMVQWAQEIWRAIKDFDVGKALDLGFKGLKGVLKESLTNPLAAIATAATIAVGGKMVMGAAGRVLGAVGLGGAGRVAGTAAGTAGGGLLRAGGGALLGGLGGLGGLAGGGAMLGAGIAGAGIAGAGLGYYGWTQAGKKGGAGWMGVGEMAAGGALLGGAVGSVVPGVGTLVGAGVGGAVGGGIGLAKKFGLFGGGGDEAQAAQGASMENVGNTIYATININADGLDEQEVMSRAREEMERLARDQGASVSVRSA